MFGSDIALNHQYSRLRHSDFIREAERERRVQFAVNTAASKQRSKLDIARATVATALLRIGNRLMPEEPLGNTIRLSTTGFELRPGR